ncbi:MAG: hypothetical protein ACLPXB_03945 [Thiobacillaceae bacterium]
MREWGEQEYLLTLLQATADTTGGGLKPEALAVLASDLDPYPLPMLETALARCRDEFSGTLTRRAIRERLPGAYARPGPYEAWGMVLKARDENDTVVWCHEMEMGWWAAVDILRTGDRIGARSAFIEVYTRHVAEAHIAGTPAKWAVSPGRDGELRRIAVERAYTQGLLTQGQRLLLAPPVETNSESLLSNMGSASRARQVRELLMELATNGHASAQHAREAQTDKASKAQAQREVEAARKSEMLQRAQAHPLWNQTPVEASLTEETS